MAEQVLTNAYTLVNAVDLSDHLRSLDSPLTTEAQDKTAMGATYRTSLPGLIGARISAEYNQDYATGKVDQTLAPLALGRTTFAFNWRPVNGNKTTQNPEYQFTVFLTSYTPIQGTVGGLDVARAEFEITSTPVRAVA